jgi:Domain of unknown function (DUF4157)
MSDSLTTATPEITNAAPAAHLPVQENQVEAEVDRSQVAGQRVMRSIGGGSPEAPPEKFTGALGSGSGGLWRQMQRSYGNQYVGEVIQTKLTVGQPGDIYEQEADRVADAVVQMREPNVSGVITNANSIQPLRIQRMCTGCENEKEEKIHPKESLGQTPTVTPRLETRLDRTRGGGEPLPQSVRSFMEPRFGADFSGVRVHSSGEAGALNQELNAQAFTRQRDIYFGEGKYSPDSQEGKRLLAHELTHVLQQGNEDIQRFEEKEHKEIVDEAIGKIRGSNIVELVPGFKVTAGDITSMTGDHFKSRQQIIDFLNNPQKIGRESQEEVEYVLCVKIHHKEEKDCNKGDGFSKEAKENADLRYHELASLNVVHFTYPEKGDEKLPLYELAERWSSSKDIDDLPNAVAGYRRYHLQALLVAYEEGFLGKKIEQSLAIDASGYHYLTDSFAAGHVMTPRLSIKKYWGDRLPLFLFNLKGYIANKLAEELASLADIASFFVRPEVSIIPKENFFYEQILPVISEEIDKMGEFGFGDLVSGAIHDYYNEYGIIADVGGERAKLFGDSNLNKKAVSGDVVSDTKHFASLAVESSYLELMDAHALGKKKVDIFKILDLKEDNLFLAERLIPKPTGIAFDENDEQTSAIKWEYDTADKLLSDTQFQVALTLFSQEKSGEFKKVISKLELTGAKKLLKPLIELAFERGVLTPLHDEPVETVRNIINWTPDTGGGWFGHDEDDLSMEYIAKVEKDKELKKLTLEQRARLIKNIIEGLLSVVYEDEEEAVVKLFETTLAQDRKTLYKMVEGHSWEGDFKEGWFTWDDELYDALEGDRLSRVRELINENALDPSNEWTYSKVGNKTFTKPIGEIDGKYHHYSKQRLIGTFKTGSFWTNYNTNCAAEARRATGVPDSLRYQAIFSPDDKDDYFDLSRCNDRWFHSLVNGVQMVADECKNTREIPESMYSVDLLDINNDDDRCS